VLGACVYIAAQVKGALEVLQATRPYLVLHIAFLTYHVMDCTVLPAHLCCLWWAGLALWWLVAQEEVAFAVTIAAVGCTRHRPPAH
jgi:hypothetical protein